MLQNLWPAAVVIGALRVKLLTALANNEGSDKPAHPCSLQVSSLFVQTRFVIR